MQDQELMEFIFGTIKTITRISSIQGVIYNGTLIFIIDNTALVTVNMNDKIDLSVQFGFEINTSGWRINNSIVANVISKWREYYGGYYFPILVYEETKLHENEEFMNYATSKASDGVGFYYMRTTHKSIMIPVFSGFPLLSKGDEVDISLYGNNFNQNLYVVCFSIYKKKIKSKYMMYYKIIDINRGLKE